MDTGDAIIACVREAVRDRATLAIAGSGSKALFGQPNGAAALSTVAHSGILDYRPDELVVTARAGTPLAEIEAELAAAGQILPFDPPQFGGGGTLGGALAAALAGPGRPWRGAARDTVLGVEIVNGLGEHLRFGGSVMKNVAGYDVSRLMTGAFGTLGVMLSASVRLLPAPVVEETVAATLDDAAVGDVMRRILREPVPVTATCHVDGMLTLRLSGTRSAVDHAKAELGIATAGDPAIWRALRDHDAAFFRTGTIYRRAMARGVLEAPAGALIEWGGAQVWWSINELEAPADALRFGAVTPVDAVRAKYEQRLKDAFDPHEIFNPGYRGIGT